MSWGRLAVWLATLGGVGRFPVAPGTAGSAAALGLCWLVVWSGGTQLTLAALACAFILTGPPICGVAAKVMGAHDPKAIVWDEAAGLAVALAMVPVALETWLAAFVVFRLLDAVKPFPINYAERAPGGMGIMLDDIVAGFIAGGMVGIGAYASGFEETSFETSLR